MRVRIVATPICETLSYLVQYKAGEFAQKVKNAKYIEELK